MENYNEVIHRRQAGPRERDRGADQKVSLRSAQRPILDLDPGRRRRSRAGRML
jgi:hypothetical protein